MSSNAQSRLLRGLLILAIIAAAIYGIGRLLTSNVNSVVGVNYHVGKIEANSSSSFAHSHSSTSSSVFLIRRIAISRVDDHPVLVQVIEKLRDDLLALSFVDEVDVYGPGETPGQGGLLYDTCMAVSIDVQQDDKLFIERDFKATVHIAAGVMPFNSHSTYTDHLSTPGINYSLNGQIDHTSQSTQAGTPYKMIADNIAEELAGKLTEQFTKWHEEFGADVDWPDDLMGDYPQDLTTPWPVGVKMDPLVDGYGLMQHRHALWSIETDSPRAIMQAFHQAYTDAGWRIDEGAIIDSDEHNSRYHFRAWNGSPHQVEVFEVREDLGEREPGEVSRVCVRYLHRFDQPETRAVIDQLLEDDADLSVLRCLTSQMDREQKTRYYRALAASKPTDPHDYLTLAKYQHENKQGDQAKRYLRRASLFAYKTHDRFAFDRKLQKAAEEMGFDRQVVDPTISSQLAEEVGYIPLEALIGNTPLIGINQALQFYYRSQDRIHLLDLWFDLDPENSGRIRMNHYEREGGGAASWGGGAGIRTSDPLYWGWRVVGDQGTYIVHFRQQPDNHDLINVEVTADSDADGGRR